MQESDESSDEEEEGAFTSLAVVQGESAMIEELRALRFDAGDVRATEHEGSVLVSAVDTVRVVTGKCRNYAAQQLRRMRRTSRVPIDVHMVRGARGGRHIPFCDAATAGRIVMMCPGADDVRASCADLLVRYLRGDPSLLAEITENNAAAARLPEAVRRFVGYTSSEASTALMQISEFAHETVRRFKLVSDWTASLRQAQWDDETRVTALAREVTRLSDRLVAVEERLDCAQREAESARVAAHHGPPGADSQGRAWWRAVF
jgi:hypothetical protein